MLRMAHREVLLLDDSEPLREAFRLLVEGRGYQVAAFADGFDALAYLRENGDAVGLIVLDLEMPTMTGFQFLTARAQEPVLERIPVVVLTALPGPHQFGGSRVEAVLQKPVPSDQLLQLIKQHCDGAAPGAAARQSTRPHKASGVQPKVMHGTDFDEWYRALKTRRTAD
jgi:CheY-like chemotaxis protein